jgi:glycosyltransferase involved in cell wall biosynthesis
MASIELSGLCSIGVVIRDRLSVLPTCLRVLRDQGLHALPVIAVVGGADPRWRETWKADFPTVRFVFTDEILTAGRSRNIVIEQVNTPAVALLDADLIPHPGWLDRCCERLRESAAAVVVPLILEAPERVHAAGNLEYMNRNEGVDHLHKELRFAGMPYGERCGLPAAAVDYGETHCLVCDVAALRAVGGFDDELAEFGDVDLGRRIRRAGREVWFEPRSVVYFQQGAPIELEDIDVFAWRWAPPTLSRSAARFADLWGVDITEEGAFDDWASRYNLKLGRLPRRVQKTWALTVDRWLHNAYSTGRRIVRQTGLRVRSAVRAR